MNEHPDDPRPGAARPETARPDIPRTVPRKSWLFDDYTLSEIRRAAATGIYDIRGGDQYVINGNVLCSVGFAVNNGGFVTAGHCGRAGNPTWGYNNAAQGTFVASSFPGDDYAWVRTNADWTPRPWVNDYGGGTVAVAGTRLVYLLANPSSGFDFSGNEWRAIVARAAQRATQFA